MRRWVLAIGTLALASCHRGRPVLVEGTIESLSLEKGRAPIVVLHVPGSPDVQCRFPASRFEEISKLARSQLLRVRGTLVRESGVRLVENCAIEFAGRKPGQEQEDDDD